MQFDSIQFKIYFSWLYPGQDHAFNNNNANICCWLICVCVCLVVCSFARSCFDEALDIWRCIVRSFQFLFLQFGFVILWLFTHILFFISIFNFHRTAFKELLNFTRYAVRMHPKNSSILVCVSAYISNIINLIARLIPF